MKNAEFMELLNLYLDHEILAADAARLEIEVQTNADRRKVYQQYCQMQRASRMLAVDFQTVPAASFPATEKQGIPFQSAPRRRAQLRPLHVLGAMAAAACVALVFSSGRLREGINAVAPVQDPLAVSTPGTPLAASQSVAVDSGSPRSGSVAGGIVRRPMLVNDPLLLGGSSNLAASFVSAAVPANDELAWVRTLRIAPLQSRVPVEDLRFDAQPATLSPESRALRINHAPTEEPFEMAAFRFTK